MPSNLLLKHAVYSVLSDDDAAARAASMNGDLNATGDKSEEKLDQLLQAMSNRLRRRAE